MFRTRRAFPMEGMVVSQYADVHDGQPASAMVRSGRYKLIAHQGDDIPQLFNLEAHPPRNE